MLATAVRALAPHALPAAPDRWGDLAQNDLLAEQVCQLLEDKDTKHMILLTFRWLRSAQLPRHMA
jgi:hypothetical protein